jgi:hypothetical protein
MLMALADSFPLRKSKRSTHSMQTPQAFFPAGQDALMQLMQMSSSLMRRFGQDSRDDGDIRVDLVPPRRKPALRDIIADGPPPTIKPALPPPSFEPPASSSSAGKVMKKKKKRQRKRKHATTAPIPVANEPAVSEKDKLTTDALGACSDVLESLLTRHKAKRAKKVDAAVPGKGDAEIATVGKGGDKGKKGKKSKKPPLGCSKCRYLRNGCAKCRNR